ncbi:MAG: SBBP repeat-containing protein [Candidatus Hodarchaeota archaeon]
MKNRKIFLMALIVILYFSIIVPFLSASNSVAVKWYRTWGSVNYEECMGMTVDSSGNIYLAGYTYITMPFGDMVLVKYDSSGVQQWNRTWGGIDPDFGLEVAVDSSGNIYLAGNTNGSGAVYVDLVLVKYDSSGVQQWNRTWGGVNLERGWGVAVDSSDNVYVSGWTYSFGAGDNDMVLVKYDSSGVQKWNRTWGGIDDDGGLKVAVDSSDNVYLAGRTRSSGAGDFDLVLVKYDSSGVQQWNRTWGGIWDDKGMGVAVDSSDNVYLAGYTFSFGMVGQNMVLVKYDSSGVQQWNRTWGGVYSDRGTGIAFDSSGNVYLAGFTLSFGAGDNDMVLVKYDSSGVEQWYRTWGGIDDDYSWGVAVDLFDNVYLSGGTSSFGAGGMDMVLVKYGESKSPAIYGYDLLLFISVIGVITAITGLFLNKKYHK